jgi:hypothetical protein
MDILATQPKDYAEELLLGRPPSTATPLGSGPPTGQGVSRVLVVPQPHGAAADFFAAAAHLCAAFAVTPVVLIRARSQSEAHRQQALAEDQLGRHHLAAYFDCLIGDAGAETVAQVARWRRCSHVFLERPRQPSWWARLWGKPCEDLHCLSEELTVLTYPGPGRPVAVVTTLSGDPGVSGPGGSVE